ncbi:hypothetical protein ACIA5D_17755 [Actinoplanes sp. NPDC051513]|uniref:hypothetical protein n=1 Tax=Actinoplanes sp. NPDC051513 TaxID=3363908 RepID=UPI0037925CDF
MDSDAWLDEACVIAANDGNLDELPAKTPNDGDGRACDSEWRGPTDEPHESPWLCCLSPGHGGTHRGSDSVSTVAEWRDEDAIT